jgi:hypothetical protein
MPCGNVWVTSFVTGVPSQYEYMCWPDGDLDGVNQPPDTGGGDSGGGGGSTEGGVTTGGTIPGPVFDPGGGDGVVVVGGPDDGDDPNPAPLVSPNPGWNSGAHSIENVPPDWNGMVSFDVADVQGVRQGGVAVGFALVSELPTVGRSGYDHLRYGLVFTTDYLRVIHAGLTVLELDYVADVRANREPGATTDVVNALMYGNFVKWVVNGVTVFGGLFNMPGNYALDATLYLAFDEVDNPKFEAGEWGSIEDGSYNGVMSGFTMDADMTPGNSLDMRLGAFAAQYSEGVVWNLSASFGGFSYEVGEGEGINATLSGFQMIASDIAGYTPYVGALKGFTMEAGMSAPDGSVDYSVLYAAMSGFDAEVVVDPLIKLQGSLGPFQMIATFDSSYMELRGTMQGFRMKAYGGDMTPLIEIVEGIGARIPVYQSVFVGIMLVERIDGAVEAVGYATVTADGTDQITAADEASYTATLLDAAMELIGLGERAVVLTRRTDGDTLVDDGEAWVVNTRTQASTRYDQYGFNSFAAIGGRHFGVRTDGVYLLNGTDDAGVPITSGVSFGKQDFGMPEQKTVRAVYAGISAQGNMFLKIGDGKSQYTYRARRTDDYLRQQRFDPGKGLRSTYFTFELTNETDAFELDSVRFDVVASQRRIG